MCAPVRATNGRPRLSSVSVTTNTSPSELAIKGVRVPFSKPLSMHRRGPRGVGGAVPDELDEPVPVVLDEPVPVALGEPVPVALNEPVPVTLDEPVPVLVAVVEGTSTVGCRTVIDAVRFSGLTPVVALYASMKPDVESE